MAANSPLRSQTSWVTATGIASTFAPMTTSTTSRKIIFGIGKHLSKVNFSVAHHINIVSFSKVVASKFRCGWDLLRETQMQNRSFSDSQFWKMAS